MQIEEINDFEQILSDEDALILKFLFLLPRKQNAQVYRKLRKDPDAAWKVSDYEIEIGKQLAKRSRHAHAVIEEVISATSTDHAPWIPLASADRRHGDLSVGQTLRDAIVSRLQQPAATGPDNAALAILGGTGPNVLDSLDLFISLERDSYSRQLKKEQRRLTKLTLGKRFEKRALVAVFEGNDAAGKGGSIRRVVKALDPRTMRVVRIAAPSDEEREHPYLWRFWRHVPRQGYITIFDRSWYGRVLVERVEGFCSQGDVVRAFKEIRSFETDLMDAGVVLFKFWLAISNEEQLRRFQERQEVGYKRHKITEEDWRNREN